MTFTRFARNLSAATVAGIAGYASYWHQVSITLLAGERRELAHIMPLSVDGMLVLASIVMVDSRREGRRPHWITRFFFGLGIAASIAANVASAQPTWLGRLIAAWPAVGLLGVVEMLSRKGRRIEEETPAEAPAAESAVASASVQAAAVVDMAAAQLPVPVSPAAPAMVAATHPAEGERRSGTGPIPRRAALSPLTGEVLMDRAPRV